MLIKKSRVYRGLRRIIKIKEKYFNYFSTRSCQVKRDREKFGYFRQVNFTL